MEPVFDKDGEPVYETDSGKPLLDLRGLPVQKLRKRYEDRTTVYVSKSTMGVEIYSEIDTGLDLYPVAWGVWEKQKNQYHGRALVTGIIPNQIFINSSFAMVMRHEQLQAFPKRIYNADLISDWSNEIGVDIGVRGLQPNQPINQVATTLSSPDISNQIIYVIEKAINYTKECLGTTDAQLGSAKIDNTSALMVLNTNSQTPLENIRANLNEWVEDIVAILLDMMGTYYGERPIVRERTFAEPVMDEATGAPTLGTYDGLLQVKTVTRKVIESYSFQKFKRLYFNCRVDVGAGNAFSQIAMLQTLDNMRREGVIELVDYLERVPDTVVPGRQRLIQKLKTQQASANGGTAAGMAPMHSPGTQNADVHRVLQQMNPAKLMQGRRPTEAAPTADDAINALPMNVREQFDQLPPRAKGEVAKAAAERMKQ